MDKNQKQNIEVQLIKAVNETRSTIINAVEILLSGLPGWSILRRQLLKAFGDRGLSGKIVEILNSEYDRQHGGES